MMRIIAHNYFNFRITDKSLYITGTKWSRYVLIKSTAIMLYAYHTPNTAQQTEAKSRE